MTKLFYRRNKMTKIFTKADIEFEHFLEVLKPADGKDVAL